MTGQLKTNDNKLNFIFKKNLVHSENVQLILEQIKKVIKVKKNYTHNYES